MDAKRGWNDHNARQRLGTVRREISKRLKTAMERGWLTSVPADPKSKRLCTVNSKMLGRLYKECNALERFLLRGPDEDPDASHYVDTRPNERALVPLEDAKPPASNGADSPCESGITASREVGKER